MDNIAIIHYDYTITHQLIFSSIWTTDEYNGLCGEYDVRCPASASASASCSRSAVVYD
jgi:hypothetical protein